MFRLDGTLESRSMRTSPNHRAQQGVFPPTDHEGDPNATRNGRERRAAMIREAGIPHSVVERPDPSLSARDDPYRTLISPSRPPRVGSASGRVAQNARSWPTASLMRAVLITSASKAFTGCGEPLSRM